MFGATLFGLDTGAWLAEQRRATTALIERAARPAASTSVRTEGAATAVAGCAELACC